MIDKLLLKKRFEKSLETYDENAIVQNAMAVKLIELLDKQTFNKIFEFGVGSGNLTRLISENIEFEKLYLNDIVKKSEKWAKKYVEDFEFLEGDIEKIAFPPDLDLVISNAAIQWVKDIDGLFEKVFDSLKSGGVVAFTTFGIENFEEIQHVLDISLKYFPVEFLKEKLQKHFDILYIEEGKNELEFKTPACVLKHIQNTGVNCLSIKNFYKSGLIKFNYLYKKLFSTPAGVKLTYHPIYVVCKKN